MPGWFDRLIAAIAGASSDFSPDNVIGPVLPCQRRRPTVELVCHGGGRFRATGSPVSGDGIYHWRVKNGAAELTAGAGPVATLVRATPPAFDIEVYYELDGQFSDSAVRRVTLVPRLIHFIWAGGTRIMPGESFRVVCDWARVNAGDGFRVIVWIDRASHALAEATYRVVFGERMAGLPIEFWDITEHGVVSASVRYEIDKLWPNYGSSSDLLRYAILARFGGAYFDSDVLPAGTRLIESHHFISCCAPVFACNFASQGGGVVGNDAFICSPGHPLMQAILDTSLANYRNVLYNYTDRYNHFDVRLVDTMLRTGPGAVLRALLDRNHFTPAGESDEGFRFLHAPGDDRRYRPSPPQALKMDGGLVRVREGAFNDNGWLNVPVKVAPDLDAAIETAAAAMRFEMTQMRMLRIEGTIKEIVVAVTAMQGRAVARPAEQIRGAQSRDQAAQLIAIRLAAALVDVPAIAGPGLAFVEETCPYPCFQPLWQTYRTLA